MKCDIEKDGIVARGVDVSVNQIIIKRRVLAVNKVINPEKPAESNNLKTVEDVSFYAHYSVSITYDGKPVPLSGFQQFDFECPPRGDYFKLSEEHFLTVEGVSLSKQL